MDERLLEQMIEERKQTAINKEIFEKGETIAEHLIFLEGSSSKESDVWMDCQTHDGVLVVEYTKDKISGHRYINVQNDGKLVYKGVKFKNREITQVESYVPEEEWEKEFEALYETAKKVQQDNDKKAYDAKITDLKERFGLP